MSYEGRGRGFFGSELLWICWYEDRSGKHLPPFVLSRLAAGAMVHTRCNLCTPFVMILLVVSWIIGLVLDLVCFVVTLPLIPVGLLMAGVVFMFTCGDSPDDFTSGSMRLAMLFSHIPVWLILGVTLGFKRCCGCGWCAKDDHPDSGVSV